VGRDFRWVREDLMSRWAGNFAFRVVGYSVQAILPTGSCAFDRTEAARLGPSGRATEPIAHHLRAFEEAGREAAQQPAS
jgi:hypothetical protein